MVKGFDTTILGKLMTCLLYYVGAVIRRNGKQLIFVYIQYEKKEKGSLDIEVLCI